MFVMAFFYLKARPIYGHLFCNSHTQHRHTQLSHAARNTYAESSVWPKSPKIPRVMAWSGPIFGGVTNDRTELIAKASSPHE